MKKIPVLHAVVLFCVWVALTLCNNILNPSQSTTTIIETIQRGISYPILSAGLILIIYLILRNGYKQVGFISPSLKAASILIYPVLVISLITLNLLINESFNDFDRYKWLLLNSLLVGFSEELMFRGILFFSLNGRLRFSQTVVVVSVLFGCVHILNFLITGTVGLSLLQALLATMSGFLFMAVRVQTRSLWICMLLHAAFDFVVSLKAISGEAGPYQLINQLTAVAMAGSPLLFGIVGILQLRRLNATTPAPRN